MGEGDSLIQNGVKDEVKKNIYQLIQKKGGDIEAYKQVINETCKYLRQVLGFMTFNLVMERISRMTYERFSSSRLPLTKNGLDLSALEDSEKDIEVLKFYIDCAIELLEELGGDTLLKCLMRRLNHVGTHI